MCAVPVLSERVNHSKVPLHGQGQGAVDGPNLGHQEDILGIGPIMQIVISILLEIL